MWGIVEGASLFIVFFFHFLLLYFLPHCVISRFHFREKAVRVFWGPPQKKQKICKEGGKRKNFGWGVRYGFRQTKLINKISIFVRKSETEDQFEIISSITG